MPEPPPTLTDLPGWSAAEAAALESGVRRHTAPSVMARPHQARWLPQIAAALARGAPANALFIPARVHDDGFLTAYYEPVIAASRTANADYGVPLYRRPPELARVCPGRADLPGDGTFARQRPDGTLEPMPDRAAIVAGALAGRGLELAYVADPVDAFFAQVQGSARLTFPDGSATRIGYHGKTGHAYTAIGRVLIDRGHLPEGGATMASIRALLKARPELVGPTLEANRSYVFFREREDPGSAWGPVAAGGVPLAPLRSLAVDRAHIAHGTPIYVEAVLPRPGPIARVMVAEDAGSAIVGAARGDVFVGSGAEAGAIAGEVAVRARLTVLLPRAIS